MIWQTVYLIGAVQGLFFAYVLFVTRFERWAGNTFLVWLLCIVATLLATFGTIGMLNNAVYSWLFWPIVSLPTLMGPMLYFYVRSIVTGEISLAEKSILHAVPFVALLVLFSPEMIRGGLMGLIDLDLAETQQKIIISAYIKSASVFAYLAVCLRLLISKKTLTVNNTKPLRFLTLVMSLFLLVTVMGSILSTLLWFEMYVSQWADYLELTFLSLLTYLLAYLVYIYDVQPKEVTKKYANTALTDDSRKALAEQVKSLMQDSKIFLEHGFSAKVLAAEIGIAEQYLSEVFALEMQSTFTSYTNTWRVDFFKRQVLANSGDNLLDLALVSGFKSKSSFNRIIKDHTGMTPSIYKAHILSSSGHPLT
jgi:AraC-like DNA-binding protein